MKRAVAVFAALVLTGGLIGCASPDTTSSSSTGSHSSFSPATTSSSSSPSSTSASTTSSSKYTESKTVEIYGTDLPLPSFQELVNNISVYKGKVFHLEGRITNVSGWNRSESYRITFYYGNKEVQGEVGILEVMRNFYTGATKGEKLTVNATCKGLDDSGMPLFTANTYSTSR